VAPMMTGIRERWEVLVLGAGPAGCTAAAVLARQGVRVLLVEKQKLPRSKVCGGCLSAGAVGLLESAGLTGIPAVSRGPRIERFDPGVRGRRIVIPAPGGRVVSREEFDLQLAEEAQRAGAEVRDGVRAKVGGWDGEFRPVELSGGGRTERTNARVVLCAGGLSGTLAVSDPGLKPKIHRRSRIGVGAVLDGSGGSAGTILMSVGRGGYVGAVTMAGGRSIVAAALDRSRALLERGVPEAVRSLWNQAGVPAMPGLESARWTGTPALTRTVEVPAAEGLFLIGDAAGYEEPFTGEGMTWAVASALAVAPLAAEAASGWRPELAERWTRLYRRLLGLRRLRCRTLALLVRRPGLVATAVPLLRGMPWLGDSLARALTGAPAVPGIPS